MDFLTEWDNGVNRTICHLCAVWSVTEMSSRRDILSFLSNAMHLLLMSEKITFLPLNKGKEGSIAPNMMLINMLAGFIL